MDFKLLRKFTLIFLKIECIPDMDMIMKNYTTWNLVFLKTAGFLILNISIIASTKRSLMKAFCGMSIDLYVLLTYIHTTKMVACRPM